MYIFKKKIEVPYAHQSCIYLIKNTLKTEMLIFKMFSILINFKIDTI